MLFVDKKDLLVDEGAEHDMDDETDDTDAEDEEHLEYDTPLMHHIQQMLDNTDDELAIRVLVNIIQKQEAELQRLRGEPTPASETTRTSTSAGQSPAIQHEEDYSVSADIGTVYEEQEEEVVGGATLRSGGGEACGD